MYYRVTCGLETGGFVILCLTLSGKSYEKEFKVSLCLGSQKYGDNVGCDN